MIRAHVITRSKHYQTMIYPKSLHSLSRLPRYSTFASFKALGMADIQSNQANQGNRDTPTPSLGSHGDEGNPLIQALPPATDYLTYLTLLEYSLTAKQLPTLHNILQDTTLTSNIGWDLVHLLLPFLPESRDCLRDVARLGNPREVVLKVSELLDGLARDEEENDKAEEDLANDSNAHGDQKEKKSTAADDVVEDSPRSTTAEENGAPTKQSQFIALTEMVSIIHPRIKTARPSRFLATTLPSILKAYSYFSEDFAATQAVLGLIKTLSGVGRPNLPPRRSSSVVPLTSNSRIAPDPESEDEAIAPGELALQTRLLQACLVAIVQDYISGLSSTRDIPGLAWCSRLQEKLHPNTIIPNKQTFSNMFAEEDELQERDAILGQIVALSRDLSIDHEELLSLIMGPEDNELLENQDNFPTSPSEVPLYRTGSLFLLCAITAASSLFDVPTSLRPLRFFPEYATVVSNFIGADYPSDVGTETEGLLDAVLFLGSLTLTNSPLSSPPLKDEDFCTVLKSLSLLSAQSPSPTLRYHAHVLTSSLLESHPSDDFRLGFIGDTLEHCPYENVKASAVGWLKHELLTADKDTSGSNPLNGAIPDRVFKSPSTIERLFPFLFPDPRVLHSTDTRYHHFLAHSNFYLASLNLSFLLLSSPTLFSSLNIAFTFEKYEFRANFLHPLADMEKESQNPEVVLIDMSDEILLEGMILIVEVALQGKEL